MVDNIHGIFSAAASQFSLEQFSAFTQLITENWLGEKEEMKEKLITLLGLIGKDTKNNELAQKVGRSGRHCDDSVWYSCTASSFISSSLGALL